jgi:MYXO-CTERM domain-containing protein
MMQQSTGNNYHAFEINSSSGLADGNRVLQVGWTGDTNASGNANWGMRVNNNNTYKATSTVAGVANTTVFAVLKLTYSTVNLADSVSLWINPTNLGSESLSTNFVSVTGVNLANGAYLAFADYNGSGSAKYDELRIGATWNDVTTVPEPRAALLGGLGMLALLRRRRD